MRKITLATAAAAMTWLAACVVPVPAAEPASAAAAAELRVLVKLVKPANASSDTSLITAQVAAAAGVQARYLAATSPQWHALALVCAGPDACEAALRRLGANTAAFEVVQRDERKRIATP